MPAKGPITIGIDKPGAAFGCEHGPIAEGVVIDAVAGEIAAPHPRRLRTVFEPPRTRGEHTGDSRGLVEADEGPPSGRTVRIVAQDARGSLVHNVQSVVWEGIGIEDDFPIVALIAQSVSGLRFRLPILQ
jgi:hypothetical protein